MGGFGSGRSWRRRQARETTDPLPFLDVRYLARHGYLAAGPGREAVGTVAWSRRGQPCGNIVVRHRGDDPDALLLAYRTRRHAGEAWQPVRERVVLERTPCHYGGERVWFRCPGCGGRRAVLHSAGGRFRCRACHDLAYGSTREDRAGRMLRRAGALQRRLGNPVPESVWELPPKPKGMHWRTYERLLAELGACHLAALTELEAVFAQLVAGLDRREHRG